MREISINFTTNHGINEGVLGVLAKGIYIDNDRTIISVGDHE
jgi:hypothetical protein